MQSDQYSNIRLVITDINVALEHLVLVFLRKRGGWNMLESSAVGDSCNCAAVAKMSLIFQLLMQL